MRKRDILCSLLLNCISRLFSNVFASRLINFDSRTCLAWMPCMKRVYKDKKASVHWSAVRNKERFSSRGSNARQPVVVFLHRFKWDFACSCFWRGVQATCLRCLGGYEGHLSPGRTVLSTSRPARPRLAAPPYARIRPTRGMSGFWIRQVPINKIWHNLTDTVKLDMTFSL